MRVSNRVDTRIYEAIAGFVLFLCFLWVLSQSTAVTEPQCPHCTLMRLVSTDRGLPTGITAPGPVNRALGAD